jgi:hypothetical protein
MDVSPINRSWMLLSRSPTIGTLGIPDLAALFRCKILNAGSESPGAVDKSHGSMGWAPARNAGHPKIVHAGKGMESPGGDMLAAGRCK